MKTEFYYNICITCKHGSKESQNKIEFISKVQIRKEIQFIHALSMGSRMSLGHGLCLLQNMKNEQRKLISPKSLICFSFNAVIFSFLNMLDRSFSFTKPRLLTSTVYNSKLRLGLESAL